MSCLTYLNFRTGLSDTQKNRHPIAERTHLRRLHSCQRVLMQLGDWARTGESARRLQEVELDIGDIRNYLQSFYAELQQFEQEEKLIKSEERDESLSIFCESFLKYLHLFGQFFHRLPHDQTEGQIIRQKLLFVDQYFDAIENSSTNKIRSPNSPFEEGKPDRPGLESQTGTVWLPFSLSSKFCVR